MKLRLPATPLGHGRTTWLRIAVIGAMCMAQSFPFQFLGTSLPTILRQNGLPLTSLWIFSLPLIPYWLKLLWAPLVDRTGSDLIGRRKSWIIPCTLAGAVSLTAMLLLKPTPAYLYGIAVVLVVHATIMATQDIAVDAYTIEHLRPHERGTGIWVKVGLEYLGEFIAMAGIVYVYATYGWTPAILLAATLLIVFTLPAMLRREAPVAAGTSATTASLKAFFMRPEQAIIGLLLVAGGAANAFVGPMIGPFLVDQKMPLVDIGIVTGTAYVFAGLAGSGLAAAVLTRFGFTRGLLILLGLVPFAFAQLAALHLITPPPSVALAIAATAPAMIVVSAMHFAFTLSRMAWVQPSQVATDFAAQGTLYGIGRTGALAIAGSIAAVAGWFAFHLMVAAVLLVVIFALRMAHQRFKTDISATHSA